MRRAGATVLACALLASAGGCQAGTTPGAGPSSASVPKSSATTSPVARPTAGAAADLTRPHAARAAVDALLKASGGLPVIKVDVSATSATLSCLSDGKVVAWGWSEGKVQPVESDIAYIEQATFSPSQYRIDDLGALFREAARISGSDSNQELQIVEYDQGQVLMTVTTRPESMPVFFRKDGSAINRLDFSTTAGFAEAISDVAPAGRRVLAMGWSASEGMWADVAGSETGVVVRTTRQAKIPAWEASRKAETTGPTFPAGQVDPAVLARLAKSLPSTVGSPGASVSFEVRREHQMALPVITWQVGGQTVVTTLSGTNVTDTVGG